MKTEHGGHHIYELSGDEDEKGKISGNDNEDEKGELFDGDDEPGELVCP